MRAPAAGLLLLAAALAGCGTPQERCISRETKDLRVMNQLIGETQANLDRGYGYENTEVRRVGWVRCGGSRVVRNRHGERVLVDRPDMCMRDYYTTERRPVAIDLAAERQKLTTMREKQTQLVGRAGGAVSACKAAYPES